MNISTLSQQLIAWLKSPATESARPSGAGLKAEAFLSGEQYLGKVLENLPNGRSLVQVGQTRLDMALPRELRAGDAVRLVYLTSGPRPTFQLAQTPVTPIQPVRVSDTARQVNALIRFAQGANPTEVASTSAPRTASLVTTLADPGVARAGQGSFVMTARPIVANVALFNTPIGAPALTSAMTGGAANPSLAMLGQAIDGARPALASHASLMTQGIVTEDNARGYQLPMRLRQVLSESGLFYESHLGRWTQGRMSLESIQREPQARLTDHPGPTLRLPGLENMPEEAARLAGRQLQVLEGAAFQWQGFAWPEQRLDWRVEEEPGKDQNDPETSDWLTRLRLDLPRLGGIAAEMGIGARGLRLGLTVGRAESLEEIRAALPELIERLRGAGLNPLGVELRVADVDSGSTA